MSSQKPLTEKRCPQHDRAAGPQRARDHRAAPHRVEEREHRVADVVCRERQPREVRLRDPADAAVRVDDPLRRAGRAGGVEDAGEIRLFPPDEPERVVREQVGERVRRRPRPGSRRPLADDDDVLEPRQVERRDPVEEAAVDDECARAAVVELVLEEAAAQLGVDRRLDDSGPGRAVPRRAGVPAGLEHRRDDVAGLEAEPAQAAADARSPVGERRVRQIAVELGDPDPVGPALGAIGHELRGDPPAVVDAHRAADQSAVKPPSTTRQCAVT